MIDGKVLGRGHTVIVALGVDAEAHEEGARLEGVSGVEGEIEERGCIPVDFQLHLRHLRVQNKISTEQNI